MNSRTPARRRPPRDDYLSLVKRFALRPIRDTDEYDRAARMLDSLVTRANLTSGERDYMEALTHFVEDFDSDNYDLTPDNRTPAQRLKSLMRSAGVTVSEMGDLIGSRPAASMILNGHRNLSKRQIRLLADRFKVHGEFLL